MERTCSCHLPLLGISKHVKGDSIFPSNSREVEINTVSTDLNQEMCVTEIIWHIYMF